MATSTSGSQFNTTHNSSEQAKMFFRMAHTDKDGNSYPGDWKEVGKLQAVIIAPSNDSSLANPSTWGDLITIWMVQHLVGSVVGSVVGGIVTIGIQAMLNKMNAQQNIATEGDIDRQDLKMKVLTGDCDAMLEPNGKIKQAVLKVLAEAEKSESQNYGAYINGFMRCEEQMKQRKDNPTS